MTKYFKLITILLTVMSCNSIPKKSVITSDKGLDSAKNWFKAWELVSRDIFKLKENTPTRYVFFDDIFVYTTSPLTGKGGAIINGPQLFDEKQIWYKKPHNGTMILPDGSERKVEITCFTMPLNEKDVKAFFIMPLLSFWEKEKIDDHGIGLEKLTTGVFTHEFCHSQQLGSFDVFGAYFEAYQKQFGVENFGDDMLQDFYAKDEKITAIYKNELTAFVNSANVGENLRKSATKDALNIFEKKHKSIFEKDKKELKMIDDIWLTMEGVGQYAMFEYFRNPKGANLSEETALKAVKTNSWSQEEGFAMFYLLSKYEKTELWANDFFGAKMKTIIEVLKNKAN